MRLLVDTQILLWGLVNNPLLSPRAKSLMLDPANEVFISQVTIWETAVKSALTRHKPDFPFTPEDVKAEVNHAGFKWLRIEDEHLVALGRLPPLHRDPFDRLLVAQALDEPMRLLTHDRQLAAYSDTVIVV